MTIYRSKNPEIESLRRKTVGEPCEVYTFNHPVEYNTSIVLTYYSKCGFNSDSDSWCSPQPGDPSIVANIQWLSQHVSIDDAACHVLSGKGMCRSLLARYRSPAATGHIRNLMRSIEGWFPQTAMNDICVRQSITAQFWAGKDNATFASFSVTILIVLMLFM